jgi:hypothetical protein
MLFSTTEPGKAEEDFSSVILKNSTKKQKQYGQEVEKYNPESAAQSQQRQPREANRTS